MFFRVVIVNLRLWCVSMTHSSSKLRPRWDINFRLHSARQIATSNLRNNIREDSHLDMLAVGLDALDEMLNNFIIHFVAQHRIVLQRKNILNLSIGVLKYFLVNYFLPGCNWPGISRTWSWPPIVRGSWKVPNACEAAPESRNKLNKYQHKLTPRRLQQLGTTNLVILIAKTKVLKEGMS